MPDPVRVVHFLNQFFAGVGGEEMANAPLEVHEGAIGPGRAIQQQLRDRATVVATIYSGDNWFTENPDAAVAAFKNAITEHKPDVVIAGPAFNAGRYGLACGHVCATAGEQGIPSVTAMFPENPGVLEYDTRAYIVSTGTSPADSPGVFESLARIALKLASGEALGPAETEGYLARGIRRPGLRQHAASRRAVDMLVARMTGKEWATELPIRAPDAVIPAEPVQQLKGAKIGLVTTGGLVPKGNPDRLVRGGAKDYFKYSIKDLDSLSPVDWESVHRGFYTLTVNENPNYVLPLDTVRSLERSGVIGSVHPWFYTTSGVGTAVAEARKIGAGIAAELQEAGVDAALLVAT